MIRWSDRLIAASIPTAQASYREKTNKLEVKSNIFYVYLSVVVIFFLQNLSALHLSIIQVAESSNDLLLIQLICLQLHTPHGLHGAVVLQTLLTGHDHLSGRGLVQLVGVTFLGRKNIPTITHTVHDIHTYIDQLGRSSPLFQTKPVL